MHVNIRVRASCCNAKRPSSVAAASVLRTRKREGGRKGRKGRVRGKEGERERKRSSVYGCMREREKEGGRGRKREPEMKPGVEIGVAIRR